MKETDADTAFVVCTNGSEQIHCTKTTKNGNQIKLLIQPNTLLLQEQPLAISKDKKGQMGSIELLEPNLVNIELAENCTQNDIDDFKNNPIHNYWVKGHENDGKPKLYTVSLTHYILKNTTFYEISCFQATKNELMREQLEKDTSMTTELPIKTNITLDEQKDTPMKQNRMMRHIEGIRFSGKEDDIMRDDIDEVIQSRTLRCDEENGFNSRDGSPVKYPMELQEKHVSRKFMKENHQKGMVSADTNVAILCRKGEMCKIVFNNNDSNSSERTLIKKKGDDLQFGWIYHRFTAKLSEKDGRNEVPKLEQIKRAKDGTPVLVLPSYQTIGVFYSCFPTRNGTPRQGRVAPRARGRLHITIPNGVGALDGLDAYSHVWIMFVFHRNRATKNGVQTKIRPPRLNGKKVGVLATRTPHRPNPIGLTCAKLDRIEGNMVYLSGIDLINETPIIDIKPYVPYSDSITTASTPDWIENDEQLDADRFDISFSNDALSTLPSLLPLCEFYTDEDDLQQAIMDVIQTDPRPVYMKKKQTDKLYGFRLDHLNIRCRFEEKHVTVVDIEKWN